ncbi:hypothetical protein BCEP27_10659 [Burkholderia cepacia]
MWRVRKMTAQWGGFNGEIGYTARPAGSNWSGPTVIADTSGNGVTIVQGTNPQRQGEACASRRRSVRAPACAAGAGVAATRQERACRARDCRLHPGRTTRRLFAVVRRSVRRGCYESLPATASASRDGEPNAP